VEWVREGEVFTPAPPGGADSVRTMRPWVLEEDGGALRMWYSGHDGTTGRILTAIQQPGEAWERLGIAIDAGFAGDSDRYGVESPCVVQTPGGYLMAYGGFDGEATRLHMATSGDGQTWTAQGTIMQRGPQDALAASHPCLVEAEAGWWLFFCGYDGAGDSRHAAILAAVSPSGASWDRVGVVLEPGDRDCQDLLHVLRERRRRAGCHRHGDLRRRRLLGPPRDHAGGDRGRPGSRWGAHPVRRQAP